MRSYVLGYVEKPSHLDEKRTKNKENNDEIADCSKFTGYGQIYNCRKAHYSIGKLFQVILSDN